MERTHKSAPDSMGTTIHILLVDSCKVFDKVGHHTLLTKCASFGLPNFANKWVTFFLCQRKLRVKIGSIIIVEVCYYQHMRAIKICFGPLILCIIYMIYEHPVIISNTLTTAQYDNHVHLHALIARSKQRQAEWHNELPTIQ